MLSANEGSVRRALSEPSIGSITTRSGAEPSPNTTSPRSSEIAVKRAAGLVQRLELGEDDLLGLAVDHQRAVAALADARRTRSGPRSRGCGRRAPACAATIRRQAPSQASAGSPACSESGHRAMLEGRSSAPERPAADRCAARRRRARRGPAAGLGAAGLGPHRGAGAAARGARRRAATRPEHVLVLSRSRAARSRLRERAETLLDRPHEELWIHTYEEAAEALLREYSIEAGLDPFFTTVGPADRLAILLDRVDELPLRRHEIRGNPAGLLARLLRRIDLLKAEAVAPAALREWAVAERARRRRRRRARARRARDRVRRALRAPRPDPARGGQPRRRRPGARAGQAAAQPRRRRRRGRAAASRACSPTSSRTPGSPTARVLEALGAARQPRLRLRPRAGDAALPRRRRGGAGGVSRRPSGRRRDRPRGVAARPRA